MNALNRYMAEGIGTFCLVFAGVGAAIVASFGGEVTHVGVSLVFGLVVMAMIYSIGELSGAHINPAVTVAFWVAKRFEAIHVLPYVAAQCVGAIAASMLLRLLFGPVGEAGCTLVGTCTWLQALVLEFVLTAMLMFVILRVSSGSKETGIMAGVAIGATVALEALFAGPVTGASMNPARSLGPALVAGKFEGLWIYLVATSAGACFAVLIDFVLRLEPPDGTGAEKGH